jgi:hypothetical protein
MCRLAYDLQTLPHVDALPSKPDVRQPSKEVAP